MKMIRLFLRHSEDYRYPADIERIVKVCADAGYAIEGWTAEAAWDWYSDTRCASWIVLPRSDKDLLDAVLSVCDRGES
jgi:hypothetical protein